MHFAVSVTIDAPIETVWSILTDVERWPEWTASMRRVARLDHGPFAVGSSARIIQPSLPTLVWQVTDLEPGRSFTWATSGPGARTVADHRLTPTADGKVNVELSIDQQGWLGSLVGLLAANMTRRYLGMESAGLKRRSEAAAHVAAA